MRHPQCPLQRLSQCLTVLTLRNVFLISRWNLFWYNFYLLLLVFSMWVLVKREAPYSLYLSFKYCNTLGPTWAFSFSRGKKLESFSLSLHSSLLIIFMMFLWTLSSLHLSCLVGTRMGHGAPGAAWQALSIEGWSCFYSARNAPGDANQYQIDIW